MAASGQLKAVVCDTVSQLQRRLRIPQEGTTLKRKTEKLFLERSKAITQNLREVLLSQNVCISSVSITMALFRNSGEALPVQLARSFPLGAYSLTHLSAGVCNKSKPSWYQHRHLCKKPPQLSADQTLSTALSLQPAATNHAPVIMPQRGWLTAQAGMTVAGGATVRRRSCTHPQAHLQVLAIMPIASA